VAGEDQHDKELHEDLCLSLSSASTTSVFAEAAITASEDISLTVMDIGGTFLNANIKSARMKIHMRLSRVVTDLLIHTEPKHTRFVEERGTA